MKRLISEKNKKIGDITTKILSIFYHTEKKDTPIDYKKLRNIVVVDFPMIGDLVMGIPFYKTLRKNCPNARIILVCQKWAGNIMREQGTVDEIIEFEGKKILHDPVKMIKDYGSFKRAIKSANKREYDFAIEPRGDIRNIFFMRHIHSKEYVSFNYSGGECMLSRVLVPDESIVHVLDDKLNVLEQLGMNIDSSDRIPDLKVPERLQEEAELYLENLGVGSGDALIAINPGASTEIKKWRHFPEIVKRITPNKNTIILAFGVDDDRKALEDIVNTAHEVGLKGFLVIEKLPLYIALLSKCNYMLCNDSSAGHLAAAFDIPVVVIFGPYEPEFGKPISRKKVVALSKDFKCKPCFKPTCSMNNVCIEEITVDEVWDAFKSIFIE